MGERFGIDEVIGSLTQQDVVEAVTLMMRNREQLKLLVVPSGYTRSDTYTFYSVSSMLLDTESLEAEVERIIGGDIVSCRAVVNDIFGSFSLVSCDTTELTLSVIRIDFEQLLSRLGFLCSVKPDKDLCIFVSVYVYKPTTKVIFIDDHYTTDWSQLKWTTSWSSSTVTCSYYTNADGISCAKWGEG